MNDHPTINSERALQDFRSARQKAILSEVIARLKGESRELLSFDEVRQKLKAQIGPRKVLKEIPIQAIIGSVNRYQDFSRDFLPGQNVDKERWKNVELATYGLVGLPPIEAYQIGDAYFVSDGNHRVSVARANGVEFIQAYVTEVNTRVPLSAEIRAEELILKSEYTQFLEHTNLDQLRPGADLPVTVPGQYQVLEEHISVHRYFMGIEQNREIPYPEAVVDWYDKVYQPVVQIIRQRGLLHDFPQRTEADLYLWIGDHRAALEEQVNSLVEVSNAADDLVDQYSQRPYRVIARVGNKIVKAITPNILEAGPAPGVWRRSVETSNRDGRLFNDILVPINGHEDGWFALDQALVIAKREGSNLHGLFIANGNYLSEPEPALDIKSEFLSRCKTGGVRGELQQKNGDITANICELARWNDLVIVNLSYPPDASLIGRISSGIRSLVQMCPRPILFTPQVTKPLVHVMLAYDGSLKAQEALFIATYCGCQWKIPLDVITIGEPSLVADIQGDARKYLEQHSVQAQYTITGGSDSAELILDAVDQGSIDLLMLGGYGHNPILEVLQGGSVDEILRRVKIPLLICR